MDHRIDRMTPEDWGHVRSIYWQGIDTGDATFESDVPKWEAWDAEHLSSPRLVARAGDTMLGWGALSPVSERRAYAGVAEISLYVDAEHRRRGVGTSLLRAMIKGSEMNGIWTLQAGIFPENAASLKLLEEQGFCVVGRRARLGKMTYGPHAGRWRDVILLERRSTTIATD